VVGDSGEEDSLLTSQDLQQNQSQDRWHSAGIQGQPVTFTLTLLTGTVRVVTFKTDIHCMPLLKQKASYDIILQVTGVRVRISLNKQSVTCNITLIKLEET